MLNKILNNLSSGIKNVRDNHQLSYTIFVAIVIFSSFFFVVDKFINIAEDAQDRLVGVRVGSIQDAFVAFAPEHLDDAEFLREKMQQIQTDNPTITSFQVVTQGSNGRREILASLDPSEEGRVFGVGEGEIFDIALVQKHSSVTVPTIFNDERFFITARTILRDEQPIGFVLTNQTLSEADKAIELAISNGLVAFVLIIIALIFLFFRYARIIDYATLYRKLKEIDQLKDDFIAMASHELRSPLASIRGYVELMTDDKGGLTKEQREYARRVEVSASQLNDLVADMLDVSRMDQGRMKFEYTDFDIEELISDTVASFSHVAEKKGLKIVKEGIKETIINSDKMKVQRVLVNLISNAIKYTPKGEVKVSYEQIGDMVSIRVSDSGIGISKEDQEKLFAKFHRIRSAETKEIQGTGLGLWLTRAIILKLKGDITVESIKGVGTHFVVTLPVARG